MRAAMGVPGQWCDGVRCWGTSVVVGLRNAMGKNSCKGSVLRVPCNGNGGDGATKGWRYVGCEYRVPFDSSTCEKADGQKLLSIAAGVEDKNERGCERRSGSTFTGDLSSLLVQTGALPGLAALPGTRQQAPWHTLDPLEKEASTISREG
jgi:hypothetical protein